MMSMKSYRPRLPSGVRVRKLSVSLPEPLAAFVESRSTEAGMPFSTALATIIQHAVDEEEQARLEAALGLDAEESLALTRAAMPATIAGLERVEW
jgi:hypothetical protein